MWVLTTVCEIRKPNATNLLPSEIATTGYLAVFGAVTVLLEGDAEFVRPIKAHSDADYDSNNSNHDNSSNNTYDNDHVYDILIMIITIMIITIIMMMIMIIIYIIMLLLAI